MHTTPHTLYPMSLSCFKLDVVPAVSALLCTGGGTCRAQFGSQSFDLTHEQASYKASLQSARSIGNPASLDHARSIGTADRVTAGDIHDVLNDEEVQPQATGVACPLKHHCPFQNNVALVQHLQLLFFWPSLALLPPPTINYHPDRCRALSSALLCPPPSMHCPPRPLLLPNQPCPICQKSVPGLTSPVGCCGVSAAPSHFVNLLHAMFVVKTCKSFYTYSTKIGLFWILQPLR